MPTTNTPPVYTLLLGWISFRPENPGDAEEAVIYELDAVKHFASAEHADHYGSMEVTNGHFTSYLVVETYPHPIRFRSRA